MKLYVCDQYKYSEQDKVDKVDFFQVFPGFTYPNRVYKN